MLSNTAMKPVLRGALSYCSSFTISFVQPTSRKCSLPAASGRTYRKLLVCKQSFRAQHPRPHGASQMCKAAGISGLRQTIHSTSATRLFHAGVNEQLIMERTGHRSLDGVRSYKCTSEHQQVALSDIINLSVLEPKRLNLDNNQQQMIGAHLSIQGCTGCTTNVNYRSTYKFQLQLFTTDYDSCD